MNQYVTGNTIKELREKQGLTQSELAEKLGVTDKAVSKWENGRGLPDISLIEPISKIFNISTIELLSGEKISNTNISSNMLRSGFYVCPVCGNIIYSVGDSLVSCHGITLPRLSAEECEEEHNINVEMVEDEYYVTINHQMTKKHNISFIAAISDDRMEICKLYPEGNAEARFKTKWVKYIYCYCNKDGLFCKRI